MLLVWLVSWLYEKFRLVFYLLAASAAAIAIARLMVYLDSRW